MTRYRAILTEKVDDNFTTHLSQRSLSDLPDNEVLIRVAFSSVNYKDGLSAAGNPGVSRNFPHTPGIDAAGTIEECPSGAFETGDEVVVTGFDLGMNTAGGLGEYIRVPQSWVLPLPAGFDAKTAMAYGTAGMTAAMCIIKLVKAGLQPGAEVIVTGASGGVGSLAVALLASAGYTVTAVTGSESARDLLTDLGAATILPRDAFSEADRKPLNKPLFDGAVDCVGGDTLANVLKVIRHSGAVSCCGLVQSPALNTTVMPFILRGVSLLGVDSVESSLEAKREAWQWLSENHNQEKLGKITVEVPLEQAPEVLEAILTGQLTGRNVVRVAD